MILAVRLHHKLVRMLCRIFGCDPRLDCKEFVCLHCWATLGDAYLTTKEKRRYEVQKEKSHR